jgi:membrane associated rhomboid family serine protease
VFFAVTEVPSILVLGLWFVLQVIDGLASLGVEDVVGGVAIFAHIAGFLLGILVGFLVRGIRPRPLGAG